MRWSLLGKEGRGFHYSVVETRPRASSAKILAKLLEAPLRYDRLHPEKCDTKSFRWTGSRHSRFSIMISDGIGIFPSSILIIQEPRRPRTYGAGNSPC